MTISKKVLAASILSQIANRYTTMPAGFDAAVKKASLATLRQVRAMVMMDGSGDAIARELGFTNDEIHA